MERGRVWHSFSTRFKGALLRSLHLCQPCVLSQFLDKMGIRKYVKQMVIINYAGLRYCVIKY